MRGMKVSKLLIGMLAAVCLLGGCKQQASANDAIRAGILQHLRAVGTLNIGAMEMDFRSVSINGKQAKAEVEFRPKTGAPAGAGMLVSYDLEKRDEGWVVLQSQTQGGMIQHPAPGQTTAANPNVHSNGSPEMPNFSQLVSPGAGPANLPPGHPPINSPSASQPKTDSQKPE